MTLLPVFGTVREAYAFVWRERQQFWQLTLPPLVILAILSALVQWGTVTSGVTLDGVKSFTVQRTGWVGALSFVLLVLNIWVWLAYSVAWHRSYLLPGWGCSPLDAYRLHGRQVRFLWTAIKIFILMIPGLLVFPLFAAFAVVGIALLLFGILIYGYVYGRLLIWLPAVAVDDRLTFGEAWAVSKGNGFRLLGVVLGVFLPLILLSLPALIMLGPLGVAAGATKSLTLGLVGSLIIEFFSFIGLAASISALSIAYGALSARHLSS